MKLKVYKPIPLPMKSATEGESVEGTSLERVQLEYVEVEVSEQHMFSTLRKARRFINERQLDPDPETREMLWNIDEATDYVDTNK